MMDYIESPSPLVFDPDKVSIFLAGSIDLGIAVDWQSIVAQALADLDVVLLNPRRKTWDPKIPQSIENPVFCEQVQWELEAQEHAQLIVFYFAPGTQAPITLLEFGLALKRKRIIVCCPDQFWRKGNIDITCKHYEVPQVDTLDALILAIRSEVKTSFC
jgi:hypothetical protein